MNSTPIFLLGSGRSGTTLIQRLLNSYPDTLIWGEHHGFLKYISKSYYLLKDSPSMHEFVYSKQPKDADINLISYYKNPSIWQAWINWFSQDDLKTIYRGIIEGFFNPDNLNKCAYWGFKEIRYFASDRVIDLLLELYPNAKFLIITRNGYNVVESQLTTFHRGNSRYKKIKRILQLPTIFRICSEWKEQNSYYISLLNSKNPNIIHLKYERAVSDLNYLNHIFQSIGYTIGDEQEKILSMKEGRGSAISDNTDINNRWQRMGFIPYIITKTLLQRTNQLLGYN